MIVLDTHTWVWWLGDPGRLSSKARTRIEQELTPGGIAVSSISTWEVRLLASKGRLELTMDAEAWIQRSEAMPFVRFIPLDNRVVRRSFALPPQFHEDIADRFIVATAIELAADLVTKDSRIRQSRAVRTVW